MLNLNTLKPGKGSAKKKKRVGRGNSSGHGTYSTRGLKGQKSRSGVSNLKRLGMKSTLLNLPKIRGFKSLKPRAQAVNLFAINTHFKDGAVITPAILVKAGLIGNTNDPVKVLGQGELKIKNVKFKNMNVSATAKAQIEKMGGEVILRGLPKKLVKKKPVKK